MGKVIVVLLCTLFVCGIVARYMPSSGMAAFDNEHGITYMMLIGVCTFAGSWKLLGK